jgi:tetratricopeptide (TPR) repeat protein
MGRFRESIALYTEGLTTHPDDPKLLRHRGHRYINLRDFDRAVADLARAAEKVAGRKDEPEPPGTPNARGVILDTLKQSIYYHLGLAHYLKGDFEKALSAYELCRRYSDNPDALASVSHWLYMTLRRLGRAEDASKVLEPVRADADIIENYGYHQLLLVYKGEKDGEKLLAETLASKKGGSDAASIGYGIGNWHFVQGRKARAIEVWKTTAALETWPAFGRIAAEVELKRLGVTLK